MEKRDVGMQVLRRRWVQIHAELPLRLNLIDEFAPAAAEIEHGATCGNETLEEVARQDGPDTLPVVARLREAPIVGEFQFVLPPGSWGHFFNRSRHRFHQR